MKLDPGSHTDKPTKRSALWLQLTADHQLYMIYARKFKVWTPNSGAPSWKESRFASITYGLATDLHNVNRNIRACTAMTVIILL